MSDSRILPRAAINWLDHSDRQEILAVDSHTGGNPTRIVLSGIELPVGVATVDAAREWLRNNADHWRRRLVHEPRGGGLTCAVLPIPSKEDGCDIGAVILEPGSYPPMCGHCMIGFASVIVELDMLPNLWRDDPTRTEFSIRTPAGPVGVTARREGDKFTTITLTNVESFVVSRSDCEVDGQAMPVELLYGGDYYISVDSKAIGLSLDCNNATEIVRVARRLKEIYTEKGVYDPISNELLDVYQVLFYEYGPTIRDRAKIVVVAPPGVIDRSPCGTGTSAFFAKLVTEGQIEPGQTLTTQSIIGSTFTVTAKRVRATADRTFVTPALTGRAYINGFLIIAADAEDVLADGFAPL
ncbi:proline racemase family protein [Methylovirgula sp. 4M-Z18]|uniref:proline racemase family protein n=1 Tax=Methylovirgula sp. 4M-Z18 TaxID=2293567 RepID=UPI000E2F743E|nr:proline racemase family protein [Methylovirgula sp. 4M-Z18]RFB76515.1 proline racemase [Methylovirgula sp. 4M-Z18]